MSDKAISQDYANDVIFELEKAFWDERGKGARFRVTTVGRSFFQAECLPRLQSTEIFDMIAAVEGVLRIRIAGCAHRAVEDRLVAQGSMPFTCVPANLIVLAIEEKLDRPAELAEIKLEDGACQLLIVLFDKRPVLE